MRALRHFAVLSALAMGLGLAACGEQKQSRDTLVIGMTQYPATLNPNIESMLAKTYVLAMTRRPFTHHDTDWNLICALCETLPTLENGLAVPEALANGKKGVAVTYTIKAISELGIPTRKFHDDIMARDSTALRKWWKQNQKSTLNSRNERRRQIGLPPATIGS